MTLREEWVQHERPLAELSMHCGFHGPHDAHTWQMSLTGYCDCRGNPLSTQPNDSGPT